VQGLGKPRRTSSDRPSRRGRARPSCWGCCPRWSGWDWSGGCEPGSPARDRAERPASHPAGARGDGRSAGGHAEPVRPMRPVVAGRGVRTGSLRARRARPHDPDQRPAASDPGERPRKRAPVGSPFRITSAAPGRGTGTATGSGDGYRSVFERGRSNPIRCRVSMDAKVEKCFNGSPPFVAQQHHCGADGAANRAAAQRVTAPSCSPGTSSAA